MIAVTGFLAYAGATAELLKQGGYNFIDTETGLEWRSALPTNNAQQGYDITFDHYDADTTYRYPTPAEVDDLLAKLFPAFVATNSSGRCAEILNDTGGYPQQLEEAQAFLALFGDSNPEAGGIEALYEDADGTLRALYVSLIPWQSNGDVATTCLTGRYNDYENHRTAPLPSSHTETLVVRTALDRKAPSLTLFRELDPTEVGFAPLTLLWGQVPNPYYDDLGAEGGYSDSSWQSQRTFPDYTGQSYYTEFKLAVFSSNGLLAPWVRVNSLELTGPCTGGDTDIGGGWCRRTFASAEYQFTFTGEPVDLSGTYVDNQGVVDNIEIDQIWNNVVVDYSPWNTENKFHPKSPGWAIYIEIETTSIADGDPYDFNAADINPGTLKVGPGLAQFTQYQGNDIDGDGDTDYIFKFNIGDTGITCLDTSITIAGRTYSGAPIAGSDVIVTVGCEETVDIDVDPFNAVNTIRPNDDYNIIVALLGMRTSAGDAINLYPERERTFNAVYSANGVDRETLRLGPAETASIGTSIVTDIDGDSYDDLLVNFNVYDAGIACGDTELEMIGNMNSGLPIEGFDTIVTEDCSTGVCHP
jgi:hypothetical protein